MIESRQQRRFRARKGDRVPGFDGQVGKRQAAAIVAEEARQRELGLTAEAAFNRALEITSRRLPIPAFAKRHRAPRPSRSDNPHYRNPALADRAAWAG